MQDQNDTYEYASIIKDKIVSKESIVFLLIGRTGVGKSSTINSLVGSEVAPYGKFEATTKDVEIFETTHEGIKYEVIDTPGLCDDLPEVGNDDLYLEKIRKHINNIDIIWFVTELDATRVSSDEKRGIKLITNAFGQEIWAKSVVIFTYSDKVEEKEFELYVKERSRIIKKEISIYSPKEAPNIPCVPVSNKSATLPNGEKWLGELFTQVFLRFSDDGAFSFFKSLEKDLGGSVEEKKRDVNDEKQKEKTKGKKARIELNDNQKEKVKDSLVKRVVTAASTGAAAGAKIGSKFGPVGTVIGATAGAVLGGAIGWLFS